MLIRIRPGVAATDLMAAVRQVYAEREFLLYWCNNIGHGLGLTIHEPPKVGGASQAQLQENMVITIGPNRMVPGFGGYAQCDVVRVGASGPDQLTPGLQGIVMVGR